MSATNQDILRVLHFVKEATGDGRMAVVNENYRPMPRSEADKMVGLARMIHDLAAAKEMPLADDNA